MKKLLNSIIYNEDMSNEEKVKITERVIKASHGINNKLENGFYLNTNLYSGGNIIDMSLRFIKNDVNGNKLDIPTEMDSEGIILILRKDEMKKNNIYNVFKTIIVDKTLTDNQKANFLERLLRATHGISKDVLDSNYLGFFYDKVNANFGVSLWKKKIDDKGNEINTEINVNNQMIVDYLKKDGVNKFPQNKTNLNDIFGKIVSDPSISADQKADIVKRITMATHGHDRFIQDGLYIHTDDFSMNSEPDISLWYRNISENGRTIHVPTNYSNEKIVEILKVVEKSKSNLEGMLKNIYRDEDISKEEKLSIINRVARSSHGVKEFLDNNLYLFTPDFSLNGKFDISLWYKNYDEQRSYSGPVNYSSEKIVELLKALEKSKINVSTNII